MKELFREHFEKRQEGDGPSWLQSLRQKGMEAFQALELPTTDQEDWRYTSLEPLKKFRFAPASSSGKVICRREKLPPGVIVGSFKEVLQERPEILESYLGRRADLRRQSFVALNTAFLGEGTVVYLPRGTVFQEPIEVIYISSHSNGAPGVSHPRTVLIAEESSQGKLIEAYSGPEKEVYWTNAVTELFVGDGATIEHCKVVEEGEKGFHFGTLSLQQGGQSQVASHLLSFGGSLIRNETEALLQAEGADCTLNGLYIASGSEHIDNQTSIDHARPHGTSNELYKGILGGSSQGVFNGKIIVRPDAEKTNARQTNKNLLLSEEAIINTKPLLEIFNNDVKCNHGATIGRLDESAIFYLRSRGISEKEARGLLIYAFAGDLVDRIKIPGLQERLQKQILQRLGRFQRDGRRVS